MTPKRLLALLRRASRTGGIYSEDLLPLVFPTTQPKYPLKALQKRIRRLNATLPSHRIIARTSIRGPYRLVPKPR